MESIFGPIFDVIGQVLAFLYDIVPNLGVDIILLTCLIMLLLYPLTAKQAKSMMAMQRVQPEIKKLQQKYKGDRQKLNEEMMEFYKENKINPLAGCLPLLVQLPIFISLFNVLRDPQKYVPKDSSLFHSLCDGAAKCFADPPKVNAQHFLGLNLELSATDAHDGFLSAAPYFILVGLVAVTGYLSVRQAQKRTPAANKQMGMVMRVLPIVFTVISISFPSGLVLYFVISNLWRFGQQELIFRRHGSAHHPSAKERRDAARAEKTEIIDAESREIAAGDGNGSEPSGPKPVQPAKRKTPEVEAADDDLDADDTSPSPPPPPSGTSQGGLRGMFKLPPPIEPNGGGSPAKARSSSQPAKGGGATPRPPQQRRRNKKKRKR
jgi:YidC/Oxa1 family membrane protein insertase